MESPNQIPQVPWDNLWLCIIIHSSTNSDILCPKENLLAAVEPINRWDQGKRHMKIRSAKKKQNPWQLTSPLRGIWLPGRGIRSISKLITLFLSFNMNPLIFSLALLKYILIQDYMLANYLERTGLENIKGDSMQLLHGDFGLLFCRFIFKKDTNDFPSCKSWRNESMQWKGLRNSIYGNK